LSLPAFALAFPKDAALRLVDAGSAGDPREREPKGESRRGDTRKDPVAPADKPGSAQIHITRYELMSSMLRPNRELVGVFRKKLAGTEIASSLRPVAAETLRGLAGRRLGLRRLHDIADRVARKL